MDEIPDMDDLLDEMEAEMAVETRANQAQLPPLPVSVTLRNVTTKKVSVLRGSNLMNDQMQGEVIVDMSELPKSFKPIPMMERSEGVEMGMEVVPDQSNFTPKHVNNLPKVETIDQRATSSIAKPVKEEIKPDLKIMEAVKIVEETPVAVEQQNGHYEADKTTSSTVDAEYDEMLEYLNGCDVAQDAMTVENEQSEVVEDEKAQSDSDEGFGAEENIDKDEQDPEPETLASELIPKDDQTVREAAGKVADQILDQISDELEEQFAKEIDDDNSKYYNLKHCVQIDESIAEEDEEDTVNNRESMEMEVDVSVEERDVEPEDQIEEEVVFEENNEEEEEEVVEEHFEDTSIELSESDATNESSVSTGAPNESSYFTADETISTNLSSTTNASVHTDTTQSSSSDSGLQNDTSASMTTDESGNMGDNSSNMDGVVDESNDDSVENDRVQDQEPEGEEHIEVSRDEENVEVVENVVEDVSSDLKHEELENAVGETMNTETVPEIERPSEMSMTDAEEPIPVDNSESPASTESDVVETAEDTERPRFDSSIATIHVLHESDSDDSVAPRRERRLTESELQLGKTCPYWIPDADCSNCMLCNTKFTIITRRHHCRACGRVLCGSCCNDKAVLEYLTEPGKKPQAVRVCKPCSGMLSRIDAYEQEEELRRSSSIVEQSNEGVTEEAPQPTQAVQPKGVLKLRPVVDLDGDTASTSSGGPTVIAPATVGDIAASSRRSVVFRDGVRPGAPGDDANPEEEKSTALKPKKKSKKRSAVVRRIAELKMEDELQCALPTDNRAFFLTIPQGSDEITRDMPSFVWEKLRKLNAVTIVLKKNLNCTIQIVNDATFGLSWSVTSDGFAQIGLDELFIAWTMSNEEKGRMEESSEIEDQVIMLTFIPLTVLHRVSTIFCNCTEAEYAGVRRVESRLSNIHSVPVAAYPLPRHILFFRPSLQSMDNYRIPRVPFVVGCFLNDDELQWATALPNRILHRIGMELGSYPTPIVNKVGRKTTYSSETGGTVLKVFTDFRSWTYRMKHIPGCTVSLTNDKTTIRIPRASIADLRDVISWNKSMLSWRCDISNDDDGVLICEETDPGLYSTQVFTRFKDQRNSTGASFLVLDGGSKIQNIQVNVVEDGVAIRVQHEKLEAILTAIQQGQDFTNTSPGMTLDIEFFDDEFSNDSDYVPKSQIDYQCLMNKYQYGLSLERALTQVLQVQGIQDYGIRMSHVFNLSEGRFTPEEEPKIYGMVEIAAKECVAMLEPYMQKLIFADVKSISIRLFVSSEDIEYDVSPWLGLEEEQYKFKQTLDQMIPMLYNMTAYCPNGFEVEFVLSIVSTKRLDI